LNIAVSQNPVDDVVMWIIVVVFAFLDTRLFQIVLLVYQCLDDSETTKIDRFDSAIESDSAGRFTIDRGIGG
jgi:hypothetical protein